MKDRNLDVHIIAGNHDTFFKGTNEVNSPDLLLSDYGFNLYHEPATKEFDGLKVAFLPWVCSENYERSMNFLGETPAHFLFAHLEIAGFEMNRGSVCQTGFDKSIFNKFDTVVSGHFHTKSRQGNIFYPGTAYEMTWSDYADPKGFHIFDTDTKEFEWIPNPNVLYKKLYYDDQNKTLDQVLDVENIEDCYVKVVITNKENPYYFDLYLDYLDKMQPVQVQVVESSFYVEDDDDFLEGCEDTLTLIKKYCDSIDANVDGKKLESFVTNLYNKALEISE